MASPINASICNLKSIKLKSLKGQNLQEDQPQLSQHNNILTNRVKCMLPNAHCK